MKTLAACLILFMTVQLLYAQDRQPIIDMHMHAMPANAQGPPPLAMCTPMQYPIWDQNLPYAEAFMSMQKAPECPDPVWSPETNIELMDQTIDVMERLNIVGILSGNEPLKSLRRHPSSVKNRNETTSTTTQPGSCT